MRDRLRTWAQRNAALFEDEPALVIVVTGALAAAVSEIVLSGDRAMVEEVLAIIGQIRPAASATAHSGG
jgi:hypothetical protein